MQELGSIKMLLVKNKPVKDFLKIINTSLPFRT